MKRFYSKLLLFGEHTILKGSAALATPYRELGGQWAFAPSPDQQDLPAFADYLEARQRQGELLCSLDLQAFRQDLEQGLFFDSNIPTGYGLGSSGALCAALYDRYCPEKPAPDSEKLPELRAVLAQLEGFFHGSSSGTDPLICHLDQPVKLFPDGRIQTVTHLPLRETGLFLLDTGITRRTGPLVEYFLEKCRRPGFQQELATELIPATDQAITYFLAGQWLGLADAFHRISLFQFTHLRKMIPPPFRETWKQGLDTGDYLLKLCGAGGGGFLLGLAADPEAAEARLPAGHIRVLH